jgi:hypothetical protein
MDIDKMLQLSQGNVFVGSIVNEDGKTVIHEKEMRVVMLSFHGNWIKISIDNGQEAWYPIENVRVK